MIDQEMMVAIKYAIDFMAWAGRSAIIVAFGCPGRTATMKSFGIGARFYATIEIVPHNIGQLDRFSRVYKMQKIFDIILDKMRE